MQTGLAATAVLMLMVAGLALYAWLHHSPAGAVFPADAVAHIELPHSLRNNEEHDAAWRRNGGNPYVLSIEPEEGGALLYYGASHESDPDHPQIADIQSRWREFRPTVALYEGRQRRFFYGALIEPFAGLPEPALVHKLARRDGVELFSLEPSYEDEVAEHLRSYTPEQVALFFFRRVYLSESGGQADDDLARHLLGKRTDVAGLRGSLATLDDVDQVWTRDFPGHGDWRTEPGEPGYLGEISDASRRIRGEHMIRILVDLVRKGERVLAVVGSGHVIRQEWNLRTLLGAEPAWDHPEP